jgi:hypothetical protein
LLSGILLLLLSPHHLTGSLRTGLAPDRPVIACQAKDGTIVEVFEWEAGGLERVHTNPAVPKLWERYAAACDYRPLVSLLESSTIFASFTSFAL